MITRETESKIREILRNNLNKACDDVAKEDLISIYWPEGFAERFAEIITQSIALMAESSEMAADEVASR